MAIVSNGANGAVKKTRYSKDLTDIENVDHSITISTIMLVLIGILMVFSSSYYKASDMGSQFYYFFIRQASAALLGFVAMGLATIFRYQLYRPAVTFIYLLANGLLVYVYFFTSGAKRWLTIPGIDFQFQPSELAKVAVIMLLSAIISKNKDALKT